ncbi:MAG: TolC family protein [Candidatus Omnitrophica bacterium]|nr:TolC family protein [Candidatus Omnitrophota bacterium]
MRKIVKMSAILVLLLVFTGIIAKSSYPGEEDVRMLSLDEFIRLATLNDTNFEEILIDELKLKYRKALGMPAGDLVMALKSQYDFVFKPKGGDIESSVSLSKLFPYSGTEIAAEYASSFDKRTRKTRSDFTAYISQPIAENAFGRNTKLLDKIIGLETDVADFQIIEAYEDYLASIVQLYYNWYSAYENVNTARNAYSENSKLLENIKERQRHKIALPVDVNKVSLQVLAKKENLIILENKYVEYLNMVKESIRCGDGEIIGPVRPDVYEGVTIDFKKDYEKFDKTSRTSEILEMLEEKSSFEVDKYADELLPSLDIIGGYTVEGPGQLVDEGEHLAFIGGSLDWPLPGQVERARYETSKVTLEKTKLSSENIHLRLYTGLKNLNDQIKREHELIKLSEDKIVYAQSIVDEDKKNYSLGRLSLNDLIDEVNRLEENKFNKIFHEIQMKRLIVEWLRLTDTLVTEKEIKRSESRVQ